MAIQKSDIRSAIREANDQLQSLFDSQDAIGISNLYVKKGMLLPPGDKLVKGTENIARFWKQAMEMGIKHARLEIDELDNKGQTAIERGHYTLSGNNNQVMDRGKYIVVWKQIDGHWKLYQDIWNSNIKDKN